MTSETGSEDLQELQTEQDIDFNKFEWVWIRKATLREGVSEKTIYNRIDAEIYRTKKHKGKAYILLRKQFSNDSEVVQNPTEILQKGSEISSVGSVKSSEVSSERLLNFMENTMQDIKGYVNRIIELENKNTEYRLISDGRDRQVKNLENEVDKLKDEIFQRDAEIKQLKALQKETIDISAQPHDPKVVEVTIPNSPNNPLSTTETGQNPSKEKKGWWIFK